MNDEASIELKAFLATKPPEQFIADLFTFTLTSGAVYRYASTAAAVTLGGVTWQPGPPYVNRGKTKLQRGVSVDSQDVALLTSDAATIDLLMQGYFDFATYRHQRAFSADGLTNWFGLVTRFFGQVNDIGPIGRASTSLTVKSMMNQLDNDWPRRVLEPDCHNVLFDAGCTLNRAAYLVAGAAAAGSTVNKLLSGLANPDGYFTQGVIGFTSGPMAGLNYFVRAYAGGVLNPTYPFLVVPAAGTTFNVAPGCDKTKATCSGKFGNLQNFAGTPFVPDPTVAY